MKPSKEQLVACQRKGKIIGREGFLLKYFYRNISRRFTKYIARTPLTPNQISVISFLLALFSAYLFTLSYTYIVLGVVLMHLSMVFDCVDGEIARLKNKGSEFGLWLDGILGRAGEMALYFGLAFGFYYHADTTGSFPFSGLFDAKVLVFIMLAALIASKVMVISANATMLLSPLISKERHKQAIATPKILAKISQIIKAPIGYDTELLYLLITIAALLSQILALFLLLFLINMAILLIIAVRLYAPRSPS